MEKELRNFATDSMQREGEKYRRRKRISATRLSQAMFRNKPLHRRKRYEGNALFFKNQQQRASSCQNQRQQKGFFSLVSNPTEAFWGKCF
jgi:hypothetical protein